MARQEMEIEVNIHWKTNFKRNKYKHLQFCFNFPERPNYLDGILIALWHARHT